MNSLRTLCCLFCPTLLPRPITRMVHVFLCPNPKWGDFKQSVCGVGGWMNLCILCMHVCAKHITASMTGHLAICWVSAQALCLCRQLCQHSRSVHAAFYLLTEEGAPPLKRKPSVKKSFVLISYLRDYSF